MSRPGIEPGSQELASCATTAGPPQHDTTGPRHRPFDVFRVLVTERGREREGERERDRQTDRERERERENMRFLRVPGSIPTLGVFEFFCICQRFTSPFHFSLSFLFDLQRRLRLYLYLATLVQHVCQHPLKKMVVMKRVALFFLKLLVLLMGKSTSIGN